MANINEILAALANLPRAYNAPPVTPTFTGAPLPAGLPNAPLPLTTAGQAPAPEYGGPSQVTEPPQAPFDPQIIAQLLALQPPPPQAPAPLSRAQRIFNAIGGFGAGFQGNGPQYLEQLRQPQREYQRQLRGYNEDRSRLAQTGVEIGLRQQEAKTRRAQELSDREFEAELKRETRRLNLSDDREKQLLADALLSRRQREDDERAAKLADQKDRAAKETQRNNIYAKLISQDFAPQKFAGEIADAIVHGKPMSPAAEKWRSAKAQKLDAQLARLNGAGGAAGGTSPKALKAAQEIQSIKDKMVEAEARGDKQALKQLMMRSRQVVKTAARYPQVEAGFDSSGKWPYVKVGGQALPGYGQQPAGAIQAGPAMAQPPDETVRAYAQRFGLSEEQARRELSGQQ